MNLTTSAVASWLRQTTTVQGLAGIVLTSAMGYVGGVPLGLVIGSGLGSLVLLAMPGQGDLAAKIKGLAADGFAVAQTRSPTSIQQLLRDALSLVETLPVPSAVVVEPAAPAGPTTVVNVGTPAPVDAPLAEPPASAADVADLKQAVANLTTRVAAATMPGVMPATPMPPMPPPLVQATGLPMNTGVIS